MREAAKAAGLWDTAPGIAEISQEKMNEFYEAVSYLAIKFDLHRISCIIMRTLMHMHVLMKFIGGGMGSYEQHGKLLITVICMGSY